MFETFEKGDLVTLRGKEKSTGQAARPTPCYRNFHPLHGHGLYEPVHLARSLRTRLGL